MSDILLVLVLTTWVFTLVIGVFVLYALWVFARKPTTPTRTAHAPTQESKGPLSVSSPGGVRLVKTSLGDVLSNVSTKDNFFRKPTPGVQPLTTDQGRRILHAWAKNTNPYAPPPPQKREPEDFTRAEAAQLEREITEMARQEDKRRAEARQRAKAEEEEKRRRAEAQRVQTMEGPDGKVIQFPASMSPQDVTTAMRRIYPSLRAKAQLMADAETLLRGDFASETPLRPKEHGQA